MPKSKLKTKYKSSNIENNYLLKIVICLILGSFWLKIVVNDAWQIPLPIGMIVGVLLIQKDRLKIDRKIEYAVLLIAMLVGFWVNMSLVMTI